MQIIRSVIVGVPILIVIVSLDDDFQAEGFIRSGARVSVPEIGAFQAINPKSGLNALDDAGLKTGMETATRCNLN